MYKNQQQMINQNEGKAKGKKPTASEDEEDEWDDFFLTI